MSLKEELSQKLYNAFEKNNLLPLVEAITNENNFISVDVCDIEVFENYRYMERLNFNNKDEMPYMKGKADKLFICFDIPTTITLGEIANFLEYISKKFDIKELVYGTNMDSSLAKGEIVANCLIFKEYSFEDKLPKKFFKDLIKCNFIDKLEEIISLPELINIDIDDIVAVSNDEIVGSISQVMNSVDEEYIINSISNKTPNFCIFDISSDNNLSLDVVNKLIDKLRLLFNDIHIIFETRINIDVSDKLEVNGLLLHVDESKLSTSNNEDLKEMEAKNNKVHEQKTKTFKDELELLYNVAIYCVDNPIKVNAIQNEFGLGFNRTTYILDRLEKLEIISIKLGTKHKEVLITDKDEIKRRIDALKQE